MNLQHLLEQYATVEHNIRSLYPTLKGLEGVSSARWRRVEVGGNAFEPVHLEDSKIEMSMESKSKTAIKSRVVTRAMESRM